MKNILMISFFLVFISCNTNKNTLSENIKSHKANYYYWINEVICFESDTNCLDSIPLFKDSISESITFENIDYYIPDSIKIINRTKVIYPLDDFTNNYKVVYRIMDLLDILDNANLAINKKVISSDYFKKNEIKTKYFFNKLDTLLSIKENISIDYKYDMLHWISISLLAKLDLKITGNDKLNRLKIKYKKIKFEDHVIHQYESVNKYCKNIYFKLQLITYDPVYFDRDNYIPDYNSLRFYKFADER